MQQLFHFQDHEFAKKINRIGTLVYLGVVFVFFVIFWALAFLEFMKPASEYMNQYIPAK